MANALVVVSPTEDQATGGQASSGQASSGQASSGQASSGQAAHGSGGRPRADFLAQLIATVVQAPQTRMRRRAEPQEAVAAYAALGRVPAPQVPVLSRSL